MGTNRDCLLIFCDKIFIVLSIHIKVKVQFHI